MAVNDFFANLSRMTNDLIADVLLSSGVFTLHTHMTVHSVRPVNGVTSNSYILHVLCFCVFLKSLVAWEGDLNLQYGTSNCGLI